MRGKRVLKFFGCVLALALLAAFAASIAVIGGVTAFYVSEALGY